MDGEECSFLLELFDDSSGLLLRHPSSSSSASPRGIGGREEEDDEDSDAGFASDFNTDLLPFSPDAFCSLLDSDVPVETVTVDDEDGLSFLDCVVERAAGAASTTTAAAVTTTTTDGCALGELEFARECERSADFIDSLFEDPWERDWIVTSTKPELELRANPILGSNNYTHHYHHHHHHLLPPSSSSSSSSMTGSSWIAPCSPCASSSSSSGASPLNDEAYYSSSPGPVMDLLPVAALGSGGGVAGNGPPSPATDIVKKSTVRFRIVTHRSTSLLSKPKPRAPKSSSTGTAAGGGGAGRRRTPTVVKVALSGEKMPTTFQELLELNRQRVMAGSSSKCVRLVGPVTAAALAAKQVAPAPPPVRRLASPSLTSPFDEFKTCVGGVGRVRTVRTYSKKFQEQCWPVCQKPQGVEAMPPDGGTAKLFASSGANGLDLAPLDMSKIKRIIRTKACNNWTLVIDKTRELSREQMRRQLRDTNDIVMQRAAGPKRGRLPPGGVSSKLELRHRPAHQLLSMPGRRPMSMCRTLAKTFKRNLVIKAAVVEEFFIDSDGNVRDREDGELMVMLRPKPKVKPVITTGLLEMAVAAAGLDDDEE
ncbi:unnamed protein product [Notodromas monacha]|uniref:Uncharacterized protein n=1 Tax=Notodromas monacha TaxID=399045 RepID=A0A7R9GDC2_9CRUS|nr:unnamed protein product [Notodromas monacha]CAG0918533.1 unnamed protein product [Notodromas monacha]